MAVLTSSAETLRVSDVSPVPWPMRTDVIVCDPYLSCSGSAASDPTDSPWQIQHGAAGSPYIPGASCGPGTAPFQRASACGRGSGRSSGPVAEHPVTTRDRMAPAHHLATQHGRDTDPDQHRGSPPPQGEDSTERCSESWQQALRWQGVLGVQPRLGFTTRQEGPVAQPCSRDSQGPTPLHPSPVGHSEPYLVEFEIPVVNSRAHSHPVPLCERHGVQDISPMMNEPINLC